MIMNYPYESSLAANISNANATTKTLFNKITKYEEEPSSKKLVKVFKKMEFHKNFQRNGQVFGEKTIRMPRKFEDKYRLSSLELGKGSTGSVRICTHKINKIEFAVKMIPKKLSTVNTATIVNWNVGDGPDPDPSGTSDDLGVTEDDLRQTKRIRREVKTYELTKGHPNICQLLDFYDTSKRFYYMVFEKMEGGSLLNQIQNRSTFTETEASLVTKDIANALEYLHRIGIAHRDLKPENVLCKYVEVIVPVKLADFDLASDLDLNGNLSLPIPTPELTTPVGSAEFMAPEVVKTFNGQLHHYDKRCDMWSLGVIIYIMLCGYPPFYGHHVVLEPITCPPFTTPTPTGIKDAGGNFSTMLRDGDATRDTNQSSFCEIVKYCDINTCSECRENLFNRIQSCRFDFPQSEWSGISTSAKDLISHLLIENIEARFNATDVLNQEWVRNPPPKTPLYSPFMLKRTNSTGSIEKLAQNAIAVNRLIQQCYAIHEDILGNSSASANPPTLLEQGDDSHDAFKEMEGNRKNQKVTFNTGQNTKEYYEADDNSSEPLLLADDNSQPLADDNSDLLLQLSDYELEDGLLDDPTPIGSCVDKGGSYMPKPEYRYDDKENGCFKHDILSTAKTIKPHLKKEEVHTLSNALNSLNIKESPTTMHMHHPHQLLLDPSDIERQLISRRASVEELDGETLRKRLERLEIIQRQYLSQSLEEAYDNVNHSREEPRKTLPIDYKQPHQQNSGRKLQEQVNQSQQRNENPNNGITSAVNQFVKYSSALHTAPGYLGYVPRPIYHPNLNPITTNGFTVPAPAQTLTQQPFNSQYPCIMGAPLINYASYGYYYYLPNYNNNNNTFLMPHTTPILKPPPLLHVTNEQPQLMDAANAIIKDENSSAFIRNYSKDENSSAFITNHLINVNEPAGTVFNDQSYMNILL